MTGLLRDVEEVIEVEKHMQSPRQQVDIMVRVGGILRFE